MNVKLNNQEIKKVYFNGIEIKKIVLNGVVVYEEKEEIVWKN